MLRQSIFFLTLLGCIPVIPAHGMMGHRIGKFLKPLGKTTRLPVAVYRPSASPIAAPPPKAAITALYARKHALGLETKRIEAQLEVIRLQEEFQRIDIKMQALGLEKTMRFLDNNSCTTKIYSPQGQSPLHYAAWFDDLEATTELLDMGYKANEEDIDGDTPLDMAVIAGNSRIIKMLVATLG